MGPVLLALGYAPVDPVPVMVLGPLLGVDFCVDGLELERVEDVTALAEFGETAFETFGFPVEVAPVAMTEDLLVCPEIELYLGRLDGVPVCCSMLLVTGDVAGIYWVGVREGQRRKGLGAAVTAHAVNAGRARGCAVATLQASAMGAPVYTRMGFETVRRYLGFDLATS
ncbi:MAG: GNAT family N-acetyltransferase [Myxococcales bacterium]|nr:GNAT family N-acetyltransferase [Myxococcales bacterium]